MNRQQMLLLGIVIMLSMLFLVGFGDSGFARVSEAMEKMSPPGLPEGTNGPTATLNPKPGRAAPAMADVGEGEVLTANNLSFTITDESFEGTFPPAGWSATGHWGKSNCTANAGSFSAWAEGAGGLTCSSVYHQNDNSSLTYGPFDLSDALTATLEFDLQLWSAQGDTFYWRASADGSNFYGSSITETFPPVWEHRSLDLSAVPGLGDLRGDSSVWIAFTWQTDAFAEAFDGSYVDNVKITKGIAPAISIFLPLLLNPCPQPGTLFHSALALDESGASYATAPDSSSLDLGTGSTDDFTIETFFYVPDLNNSTIDTLFQKSGSYWLYIIFNNNAPDRFIYRIWITTIDYVYLDYDIDLSVGWHHVAVIFDNEYTANEDRMAIFLDGSLVKSATNVEWTPGIRITSSATTLGGSYTGRLEEARLSDSVRYSGNSYPIPAIPFDIDANTRALWHFNEAQGATSFIDSSGNSNTLTGVSGAHIETCGN